MESMSPNSVTPDTSSEHDLEMKRYWEERLDDLGRATEYAEKQLDQVMGRMVVGEQLLLW